MNAQWRTKKSLEALDGNLRDLRDNNAPMGGIVVVLAGDFRQTLPVIPRSTPTDALNACLKQSYLWPSVCTLRLSTNMRVHLRGDVNAGSFAQQLLSIGDGVFPCWNQVDLVAIRATLWWNDIFVSTLSSRHQFYSTSRRVNPEYDSNSQIAQLANPIRDYPFTTR